MIKIDKNQELSGITTAVTIGKFDGLHKGHFKIINELKKASAGNKCLLVSFTNHPGKLLDAGFSGVLIGEEEKTKILEDAGLDLYCEMEFNEALRDTSAEDFFNEYILGKWHARLLVVGDDFRFGRGRLGDTAFLEKKCGEAGISLIVVPRMTYKDDAISSSRIKNALKNGEMEDVSFMLGRDYTFSGTVCEGNKLGRSLGFPTANIYPDAEKVLPRFGVYLSETVYEGRTYRSISNIGVKPTVDSDGRVIAETFLFDFDGDLYGKELSVSFKKFVRDEKKFKNVSELKAQIESDKNTKM